MINYDEKIKQYLEGLASQGIKKIIAFSGGAEDSLESKVRTIVEESMNQFKTLPVAILTGGTIWGIPKYAAELAKQNNLPTIGVYPQRGAKYALKDLDFTLEVSPRYASSEWGDESEIFAKLASGVEVIGGGAGTLIEISHIIKANEAKIKNKQTPVYLAPIKLSEFRTTANIIYCYPFKQDQRVVIPDSEIMEDGKFAARFLIEKLGLGN